MGNGIYYISNRVFNVTLIMILISANKRLYIYPQPVKIWNPFPLFRFQYPLKNFLSLLLDNFNLVGKQIRLIIIKYRIHKYRIIPKL